MGIYSIHTLKGRVWVTYYILRSKSYSRRVIVLPFVTSARFKYSHTFDITVVVAVVVMYERVCVLRVV